MGTEDKLRAYLKRATVELAQARHRLTEAEERRHEPIAVIGMACRYPGGDTVEDFWRLLRDSRNVVREVPPSRWDVDDYYDPEPGVPGAMYTRYGAWLDDVSGWDAEFFGLSPREALRMDPHQRLLLELAWEGLENSGISPSRLAGSRTGVMVGYMDTLQYGRLQMERQGPDAVSDPYLGQGAVSSVAAGRIAYQLDLIGPTMTIDTACSSSLIAVHLAMESLRRGECDLAIAAGASLTLHPTTFVQACAGLMMSADGRCKTFDEGADGYVMGEGGGLVVLEPLSKALANGRRVRAVLRGSAVNQDGRSNGLTAPSRRAQADVIGRALAAARVAPDDIDYVEAHGSGTHLGDAIELSALHDVFGGRGPDRPLRVGAVKTNIGHTQAAAGIAGLIKTALILENGLIPPNLHLTTPATAIPEDGSVRPVDDAVPLPRQDRPRLAGVSSFGLSGTNAHVIVEAAPDPATPDPAVPAGAGPVSAYVLPVSAAGQEALREQADRLATWLGERPGTPLADLARTLQAGRAELDHRRAVLCSDPGDAVERLRAIARPEGRQDGGHRVKGRPRVAFLLQGVGDQYAGLGRELYAREPVYAQAVDTCVELVSRRSGVDLRPLFFPEGDTGPAPAGDDLAALLGRRPAPGDTSTGHDPLDQAAIAHPFLFTVEYALARLLQHWGVTPDVLVGYSFGEYVAACLAGVFTLEDALHVVVERAHLISAVPAGRMVAVAAPEERVTAALTGAGIEVDVAARNGPAMTVLSGLPADIEAATAALTGAGIACRPLRSAHAFHSALLQPAREKLAAVLESVPRRAPAVTIVSNLTGRPLTAEQATSTSYWADQLVGTVRFADGVRHCVGQDVAAFVELGPGQTLGGLVRQNLTGGPAPAVLGTLPPRWTAGERRDAHQELLAACAALWELGVPVAWDLTRPGDGQVLGLPTYPFQRTRFWPDADPDLGSGFGPDLRPRRASGAGIGPRRPDGAGSTAAAVGPRRPDGAGAPEAAGAIPAGEPDGDFVFVPAWRQDPARAPLPGSVRLPGPLVVFADPGGAGTALADLAEAAGTPVVEVVAAPPGSGTTGPRREGRRLTIDPAVPEHHAEVFTGLGDGPVHVAYLWGLGDGSAPSDASEAAPAAFAGDAELRAAVEHGFTGLLLAVQALGDLPARQGVRLLTVTSGATEIVGRDAPAPHQALAHGLGRAVRHEYPGLTWSGVDLDPESGGRVTARPPHEPATGPVSGPTTGPTTEPTTGPMSGLMTGPMSEPATVLLAELTAAPPDGADPDARDALTGWRRGRRWIRAWAQVPDNTAEAVWRPDGAYLITGGTRGLGMALAKHLVRAGVRRLALVGRTPIPTDTAPGTPTRAATGETDARVAATLRDVAELKAAGAEVLLLAADTGVPDQLRDALRRARERFGRLHGVVHAAGLPAGGLTQRRTVADATAVLAPKVLAMGPLAELVGGGTPAAERPELLVLYSSAVTAFGGIGEADYCAANTVLDAYGQALAATAPSTRVVSVAWGPWRHDVWQAEGLKTTGGLAERVAAYRDAHGFPDEAGCALLDRILAGGHGGVMAVRQPLREVLNAWSSMLDLDDLVGAAVAAGPKGERFPRPGLRADYAPPRTDAEARMADLWGAYLGIDGVGVHDPFFDLGGNSLVGMAMVLAIEKELGRPVPPALLFEHATVAEFTAALGAAEDGGATGQEALAGSSARGERRRRARSGKRR
ncbi:KR domain-containing protein [Nonomuraea sp. 3-1Str]|uniref:type I polyketide synthase n=1 Tax=Nonomuraea sp. 3-1Str TaxID=2929801 RepID=UPI002865D3AA|nr:polyketide synthase [Nonomuraea sp. 3-1Str]MDR8412932.1 KR domain-containing protein [Nonomuraea sp. 3-1Str]